MKSHIFLILKYSQPLSLQTFSFLEVLFDSFSNHPFFLMIFSFFLMIDSKIFLVILHESILCSVSTISVFEVFTSLFFNFDNIFLLCWRFPRPAPSLMIS